MAVFAKHPIGFHLSPVHFKIFFPADKKQVEPLRELAYHFAIQQGWPDQQAEQVKLIVDELCSNAIEYGSQPSSEVILELYADEKAITITCQDQGQGNRLSAQQIQDQLLQPVADGALRGRGLKIIKSYSDELRISDHPEGGILVIATINHKP